MRKIMMLLLFLWSGWLYADGHITLEHLKKWKQEGYNEERILLLIKKYKLKSTNLDMRLELELMFSERFVKETLGEVIEDRQLFALPERIVKEYRQSKEAVEICVFAVGVGRYENRGHLSNLPTPRVDAEDFVKGLLRLGVKPENVELLTDENARKENMVKALERLLKKKETVYIFFSGHGVTYKGELYLTCHEANMEEKNVANTCYRMEELKSKLASMANKSAVLFLDACHSGEAKEGDIIAKRKDKETASLEITTKEFETAHDLEKMEKAVFLMTSCRAKETSRTGSMYSVFTKYLLEGMTGSADSNGDKLVDLKEWIDYTRRKVENETEASQNPDFKQSRGWTWGMNKEAGLRIIEDKWSKWQEQMQAQYDETAKKAEWQQEAAAKREEWQKFFDRYWTEDNPESEEDERLVAQAKQQIMQLETQTQKLVKLLVIPEVTKVEAGGSIRLQVEGIRADGARYREENVKWVVQYGKIDANGNYTAPTEAKVDKVLVYAASNKKIRALATITVTKESLMSISISPKRVQVNMGESVVFEIAGFDSKGREIEVDGIEYSATGGAIGSSGSYTAGNNAGIYVVTAKKGSVYATAEVVIKKKDTHPFDTSVWNDCWNGEYFDFTKSVWEGLSHNKQVEYAAKYQEWYAQTKNQEKTKIVRKHGASFVFKLVPPGKFWMGSAENEKDRGSDEKRHRVLISKAFWVGETEVTQEQWQAVMGSNPSNFKGSQNPVEKVSWEDCEKFCGNASVRMLTEAEWEYACRGGTTAEFNVGSNITTNQVNYNGNYPYRGDKGSYRETTVSVKSLGNGNSWGCYDFHGNVWEWCSDWGDANYYTDGQTDPKGANSGTLRVRRGGSWFNNARYCRSAYRSWVTPSLRDSSYGFRCAVQ